MSSIYILKELMRYRKLYNLHIKKLKEKLETCNEDIKKDYEISAALKAKTDKNYEFIMMKLNDGGIIKHAIRQYKAGLYKRIKNLENDLEEIETKIMLM